MNKKRKILDEIKNHSNNTATNPSTLEGVEVVSKAKALLKSFKESTYKFPTEVFPARVEDFIQSNHRCFKYPVEYYSLGALMAAGIAIGNNYTAEYFPGWESPAILYGVVIGKSGMGKSRALKQCFRPLRDIEQEFNVAHEVSLAKHRQKLFEQENSKVKTYKDEEPQSKRIITTDPTTESLYKMLRANPKGVILVKQELLGFIKSMNQYRKGGDGEFWLEVFDNEDIIIDRVGQSYKLNRVFISICGGVQPPKLKELAQEGRMDNGFIPRLLFAYPFDMNKPLPPDAMNPSLMPSIDAIKKWDIIIKSLHGLPSRIDKIGEESGLYRTEPIRLKLTDAAKRAYYAYLCDNNKTSNNTDEEIIEAILAKLDDYCLRFALILELMNYVLKKDYDLVDKDTMIEQCPITEESILKAIKLCKYFENTARRVVEKLESVVEQLPDNVKAWYQSLPEEFVTKTALESWEGLGMKRRSMYKYMNDEKLIRKVKHGFFEKRYLNS